MVISDDAVRCIMEILVSEPAAEFDLGPLMYARGAYPPSVEVTVNGLLEQEGDSYTATRTTLTLQEALLPGDTLRVSALEDAG